MMEKEAMYYEKLDDDRVQCHLCPRNCIILPGVRIGYGSVISAGSVVNKDIPPMCIAGGNPAIVLKSYALKGPE